MSEERVPYTLPDAMTQLRIENRQLSERLDAAFKTIDGFTDASSFQWGEYQRRIKELEQTVARLEQDNKRLRHLDSMPVDAMRRYVDKTDRIKNEVRSRQYLYKDFLDDREAIDIWLASLDGDA